MAKDVFLAFGPVAGKIIHDIIVRGLHDVPIPVLFPSSPPFDSAGGLVLEDDSVPGLADLVLMPCSRPRAKSAVYPLVRTGIKRLFISYSASPVSGPRGLVFALPRV